MSMEDVVERARRIVRPTRLEERALRRIVEKALSAARREISGVAGALDVSLEGSAAKNTWIRGRAEADIFIHFDPGISREELEKIIVDLGSRIVESLGGEPMIMYADHPYVEGIVNGVTVDVVACYRVEPPNWMSATDRTQYHTRYVLSKLKPDQEDEVRLLKGFMKACGVYGAEIKIEGFSGYLTELLILYYGDFLSAVREISCWKPPIVIDLERYYESEERALEAFPDSPLIVVDPVDMSRNAAAAVSLTRLSELILASRIFLKKPSIRFFKPIDPAPRIKELKGLIRDRSILYVSFKLDSPRPRDVLWGELKRSEQGIRRSLESLGFTVYRSGSWTDERRECLMIFELDGVELPRHHLHKGPPVYLRSADEFLEKWSRAAVGPWIEGDRLYVLRRREETAAHRLLRERVRSGQVSISKGLVEPIKRSRISADARSLLKLASRNDDLRRFLAEFLAARPPFLRK
ncbi:MAG: CCA tRNA nucleotidyltransferase [Nitrososphaerota archaeon]